MVAHQQSSMQAKSYALQSYLCEEQLPLHWQLTISIMALGAGKSSVVCDTRSLLASMQNPFCSGLSFLLSHILAWTWTRRMSCLRVPDVDGSMLLSAILFAEHASNLNAVLAVSTTNK